ncbi:membrane protein [Lactiplantibacillus fabifermentans T30PCM01]|uniref:Membrane protein n=2 Tax=Lactiplantibacillus fabifermentans TaxID=483011 RepID=W6T8T9_9LACO|nr:DMT family transporter [Lactiplantibacillus fabifermentans]ETY74263.1 membrane protein [Lactiplantibacillus fabifermentans T30PCM01]
MIAVLIGIVIGVGLPLQTSINSRLKDSLGTPFLASLVSFFIGSVFLAIVTLILDHSILFSSSLFSREPVWIWAGGFLGVIYLTVNILLFPKLGSVQTVIFPVLGQILMGLIIDNYGLFNSTRQKVTVTRILGALLVLVGVVCIVKTNRFSKVVAKKLSASGIWLWRLIGMVAGMGSAAQTAINGHLGVVLGSSVKAAFISFLVGTVTLVIANLLLQPKLQIVQGEHGNPWWMWLGGVFGGLFVAGNAYLVPSLGTGLAVVVILVGQMSGGLVVDQFGLLESAKNPITLLKIVGIIVMLIGVGIIRLL